MNISIKSDDNPLNTTVKDEHGNILTVGNIYWNIKANRLAQCSLDLEHACLDIEGKATFFLTDPCTGQSRPVESIKFADSDEEWRP